MCKVKDLIARLQEYNPESYVVVGEINAWEKGFWQHYPKDILKVVVRSVKEEKESTRNSKQLEESDKKRILDNDFVYVNDDDVIVRL